MMSPPLAVTEDTPPDMLAGAMDLQVILPNGRDIQISIERSTPMMDLLVHVATANKISPGGHIIRAVGERGILPYKPSTPIGALDTWTIHIVPKKQIGKNMPFRKLPVNVINNTPFEQTFRLQVNLPRNQLYVTRVSFKTKLGDVLQDVCKEKGLDPSKYYLTYPDKSDEILDLSKDFNEYKLQQITLISKNNRPISGVSTVDIMALRYKNGTCQNDKLTTSHSGADSISSGSLECRSVSPSRSEGSSSSPTVPKPKVQLSRPYKKRRPAPKPPQNFATNGGLKNGEVLTTISHSRNSSDSSGYHEPSVLSESPDCSSLPDSLQRRSKLPPAISTDSLHTCVTSKNRASVYTSGTKIGSNLLSKSLSNLATIIEPQTSSSTSNLFLESNCMSRNECSASSMSISSTGLGRKKKLAPLPPVKKPMSMLSLREERIQLSTVPEDAPKSQTPNSKINTDKDFIHVTSSSSSSPVVEVDAVPIPESELVTPIIVEPVPIQVDTVDSSNRIIFQDVDDKPETSDHSVESKIDLIMDDEEIDRIFNDATRDYEAQSVGYCLPSPPSSLTNQSSTKSSNILISNQTDCWEYKIPAPPTEFRDDSESSTITDHDTGTVTNQSEITRIIDYLDPKISPVFKKSPKKCGQEMTVSVIIENHYREFEDDNINIKIDPSSSASSSSCNDSNDNLDIDKNHSNDLNSIVTNDSGVGSDDSSLPGGQHVDEKPPKSTHYMKKEILDDEVKKNQEFLLKKDPEILIKKQKDIEIPNKRSTLNNFKISAYEYSKPMEIFRDDSIKTSKTTEIAQNNHPSYTTKIPNSKDAAGLSRHSSFNKDYNINKKKIIIGTTTPSVKRSKSHISLLSGNYVKFNRLNVAKNFYQENISNSSLVNNKNCTKFSFERILENNNQSDSKLRKTNSEMNIYEDCDNDQMELLELQDQVMQWKENVLRKESSLVNNNVNGITELQSVQVLKGILPQLKSRKLDIKNNENGEEDYPKRASLAESEITKYANKFTEGPSVNLKCWNERPKRQVSIKLDKDYVYNKNKFENAILRNRESIQENQKFDSKTDEDDEKSKNDEDDDITDASRIPIVRAVEFKKPFVPKNSSNSFSIDNTCSHINSNKNFQKSEILNQNTKQTSCSYLFGNKNNSNNNFVNEMNGKSKTKVTINGPVIYNNNRYKSVTGINRSESLNFDFTRNLENNDLVKLKSSNAANDEVKFKNCVNISVKPQISNNVDILIKSINNRSLSMPENTKDNLLESIRCFDRERLRKIR